MNPVGAEAHYVSAFPRNPTVYCYGVPVGGISIGSSLLLSFDGTTPKGLACSGDI